MNHANNIQLSSLQTGALGVNTYILSSDQGNIVIDPGGDAPEIKAELDTSKQTLILLTHAHSDHLGALNELLDTLPKSTGYYAHAECARRAADPELNLSTILGLPYSATAPTRTLSDGEIIDWAGIELTALHIPGHSPGHLCFYLPTLKVLFSGDAIFKRSIGRSDLPGGNSTELITNCRRLLDTLPTDTVIYPGHGPETTVDDERQNNPFL